MALRAANGLLDGVTALLVLLAVVWSGYALWDNSRVYAAADNVQAGLLAFKPQPQEDNSLSFGQLRDINPDVCGWLTLDGTAIDYPVVQGESNFTYLNTDVYGSFALAGSIFLDVDCDADFSGRYSLQKVRRGGRRVHHPARRSRPARVGCTRLLHWENLPVQDSQIHILRKRVPHDRERQDTEVQAERPGTATLQGTGN